MLLMLTTKAPPPIYQLKTTLLESNRLIWRRIQVPGSMRLCCLHSAIQVVMGWKDCDLHRFEKDGYLWGVPEHDEFVDHRMIDESKMHLARLFNVEGDSMIYVYDYGDNWRHEIVLEKVIPVKDVVKTPICLAGARRCPPEDVGGASGYERFLEIIFNPCHKDFRDLMTWAGGAFQAEEFDVQAVNGILSGMRWPIRHKR